MYVCSIYDVCMYVQYVVCMHICCLHVLCVNNFANEILFGLQSSLTLYEILLSIQFLHIYYSIDPYVVVLPI